MTAFDAYRDDLHERLTRDPGVAREGDEFAAFLKERGVEQLAFARASDPPTSHAAAASIGKGVEWAVLRAHHGRDGLTDDELCAVLSHLYAPTVKSARSRLSRGRPPVLCDSGARRLSGRGKAQIVWRVT